MNDTELDEMLDQWEAPPVPASLREKRAGGICRGQETRSCLPRRRSVGEQLSCLAHERRCLPRPSPEWALSCCW